MIDLLPWLGLSEKGAGHQPVNQDGLALPLTGQPQCLIPTDVVRLANAPNLDAGLWRGGWGNPANATKIAYLVLRPIRYWLPIFHGWLIMLWAHFSQAISA